jgi:hypothetical protein
MKPGIFNDENNAPDDGSLSKAPGKSYLLWNELRQYVFELSPSSLEEWNFSKLGWNYRIRDKKRVIIYLQPHDGYFTASLVLGGKAMAEAFAGDLSEEALAVISAAKTYAEGTGIRIDVKHKKTLADIKILTALKCKY